MASANDFVAIGKVSAAGDAGVRFNPSGTNYDMHLTTVDGRPYAGRQDAAVRVIVRVKARKVLTVPSGGGFISPIFGPPKTIQGRVLFVDERVVVLKAGTVVHVELPGDDAAIDLNNGVITVGMMLNAIVHPGATFELAATPAAVS